MLRAGSVEILFPTRVILETMKDCLLIQELAIRQELTELHEATERVDYENYGQWPDPGLREFFEENQKMLVAVRAALGWLAQVAPVFLLREAIDAE